MPKRAAPPYKQPKFVAHAVIKKYYAINEKTLRTWANNGKLRHIRFHGEAGKRLYDFEHLREIIGDVAEATPEERTQCIAYARVSSAH